MRKVLITGGSRGIGAACVRRFSAAGDDVTFLYRSRTDAAQTLAAQTGAIGVQCDITDRSAVAGFFSEHPEFDVLVNNAGISAFSLLQDCSDAEWDRMIDTHLGGTFRCCRGVLPGMIRKQSGCIVNISSMWGQTGASCETAYSAAKAGIIGLTKALAQEVGPSGIRVNCVAPGVIDTDMNAALSQDAMRELAEQTPLSRIGTPDEAADAVFWLASPGSSFVTGQILGVNGGFVV